ncbi:MAG: TonB-dependent receptor plug domain-containing protein, partial [Deltaproteobacteria bacterium]|nr:TonB-dependent receptor plug domain-containing protein [Deltaproteobacteria bacterium]
MKHSRNLCVILVCLFSFFPMQALDTPLVSFAHAEEETPDPKEVQAVDPHLRPRFELEEVIVTAAGFEEEIKKIPKNVTVITEEDIAQAPSNNLVDLLAREASVVIRSSFGHDKIAGVDIRGMGDTYVSNVIVMVDGYRLNPPDL